MPPRNPPWAEQELILALDLYLRSGLLPAKDQAVAELSRVLNSLTIHSERPDAVRFRNENGVALKLANFAAIDPNHPGKGMKRGGKLELEVWERYASNEDALVEAAATISAGSDAPTARFAQPISPVVTETEVEAQYVERFLVSSQGQDSVAVRREQGLVLAYAKHLKSQGHRVTRHRYQLSDSASPLVCDLVDETAHILYEAKGDVRRVSVRMAIGQLLDYQRFESTPVSLAVLLPRRPAEDLTKLICSLPASVVWPTKHGFADIQPPALAVRRFGRYGAPQ